jgi:hypothetical protein
MTRILALQQLTTAYEPDVTCISFNFSSFGVDTLLTTH